MTEEEKEAIKFLEKMSKEYQVFRDLDNPEFEDTEKIYKNINVVLEALKKKDKQIDLMNNLIYEVATSTPETTFHYLRKQGFDDSKCSNEKCKLTCKECIKEYFEKQAEEV